MIYISKGIKGLSLNSKQLIIGLFLVSLLGLMPIFSSSLSACVFQEKTPLAGEPVFPKKEYNDWLRKQRDPSLETEAKIKSTVNTFFLAKYESWVSGKLLDFEFLFDQSNSKAQEDYAYERGLMYCFLEAWTFQKSLLYRYEYMPEFYEIKSKGREATVVMTPKAKIFFKSAPDMSVNGPWVDHIFSLELINDLWLIQKIQCNDETREDLPHGTDFEKLASGIPDRQREFDAMAEAEYKERMKNDPKFREIFEKRRKQQQERFSQQRKNEEKRLLVYHEIAGDYRFIIEEKTVHITFYVQDRYLMGKRENDSEGIVLQRIEENPMEFKFGSPDGYVYELRFLRDENGTIEKCLMSKEGEEYEGLKVKEFNISFLCLRCKIPNKRSMENMA